MVASRGAVARRRRAAALMVAVAVVCLIAGEMVGVEAARRSLHKRRRVNSETEFTKWATTLKWVWLGVFGPMLLLFLWQLARDPALPHIAKELWARVTDKLHGRTRAESIALARRRKAARSA
mmetsp:Transcript_7959/g.28379  ORF Transcript_7959/g.28379 Transcript_7959/m.28379 type:complete len:122 (-) Transcript_7959:244-609(-)